MFLTYCHVGWVAKIFIMGHMRPARLTRVCWRAPSAACCCAPCLELTSGRVCRVTHRAIAVRRGQAGIPVCGPQLVREEAPSPQFTHDAHNDPGASWLEGRHSAGRGGRSVPAGRSRGLSPPAGNSAWVLGPLPRRGWARARGGPALPRAALTGSVPAAVLCQLRPGGPERVHRLPQGQLLLHLLPAQGRLPVRRSCSPWPWPWPVVCGPRPAEPLCLLPPFGLPRRRLNGVCQGLEAASLGPACLPLSLQGIPA